MPCVPPRLVIVSGCSGGGKSMLVAALARHGFATIPEPGRRIVAREHATGGTAFPWLDAGAFARRLVDVARCDLEAARTRSGIVIFDRGLVDAAAALAHATGILVEQTLRAEDRFDSRVFLAPPWPEIYVEDAERKHGLAEAEAEYARPTDLYPKLGYQPIVLPKANVGERLAFVIETLAEPRA